MKKILTIVLVSFLWVASLHSQPLDRRWSVRLQQQAWQGDALAQYNLGVAYVNTGQSVDSTRAYLWFSLVAAQGSESNSSLVKSLAAGALTIRKVAASRMTPQEIARAEELVRNWKPVQ